MARYAVVTTVDTTAHVHDEFERPIEAGRVVNVIEYDPNAEHAKDWTPGPNCRLVQSDTLQIGDVA